MINEILKSKLEVLASDELTLQAIREVIKGKIEKIMPNVSETDNDAVLGQKYRAMTEAKNLTDQVLDEISSYKVQRSSNNKFSKGK